MKDRPAFFTVAGIFVAAVVTGCAAIGLVVWVIYRFTHR
jgi:hypothetical protein